MITTIPEIMADLKGRLDEERYEHSIGTANTAREYAILFGEDPDEAYLAGLVHDCGKFARSADLLACCIENGIHLDEIEQLAPQLVHAKLGEYYAHTLYGITKKKILSAIRYHTTGKAGMSLMEKIIFIADLTEPNRDFPDVEEIRKMISVSLTKALILCFDGTIRSILDNGDLMHPDSVKARNCLILEQSSLTV